jgi:hypothetical protein
MLSCLPVSSRPERISLSIGFRIKTDEELSAEFPALSDKKPIETGKMLADFARLEMVAEKSKQELGSERFAEQRILYVE